LYSLFFNSLIIVEVDKTQSDEKVFQGHDNLEHRLQVVEIDGTIQVNIKVF